MKGANRTHVREGEKRRELKTRDVLKTTVFLFQS